VLVQSEYALHAARHPDAAAALRAHVDAVHLRIAALIDESAARTGLQLAIPPARLARILTALHDGLVIAHVATGDARHATEGAVPDLEHAAMLLLLRAAIRA
jgi:hypothetical protein